MLALRGHREVYSDQIIIYHVVDGQMRYDPHHLARVVATTEDEEAFLT